MSEAGQHGGSPGMLNGWKEIAAFLGKSVRSVQRWERDLGLPVRRINTPDHGQIVYASRSEIEQWRQRMDRKSVSLEEPEQTRATEEVVAEPTAVPTPASTSTPAAVGAAELAPVERQPTLRPIAVVLMVAAALLLGVLLGRWSPADPEALDRVEFSGTALIATERSGEVRWRHEFAEPVGWPDVPRSGPIFVDIDRDGTMEVIVPVRYGRALTGRTRSDEVVCFRQDGRVLWRASPKHQLSQGDRPLVGRWLFRVLASPGGAAGGRSWVAFSQEMTSPAVVLEVDRSGSEKVRFIQDGAVTSLALFPSRQGQMLAVGGVNTPDARAAVALIAVDGASAQAPTRPDRLLRCSVCPADPPSRYFELPPSEVAVAGGRLFSQVSDLAPTDDGLRVSTDDHQVGLITPGLEFQALDYTDDHWSAHQMLEDHGRIAHPAEKCREQAEPREVRTWQTGTGWVSERVR
jgi:hypothetical protein